MPSTSLIGLLLAASLLAYAVVAGGGSLASFADLPSLLLVFGGLAAAALIAFPAQLLLSIPRIVSRALFPGEDRLPALVELIVGLAGTARREGLLALEPRLAEIDHPFLLLGVQMAVDGARPEAIDDVLRTEIATTVGRQNEEHQLLAQLGRFAPALGMIGTLLGLITMLGNLTDPSHIATGLSMALVTTLYGSVAANLVFLPLAERLAVANQREELTREVLLRGVRAIQAAEHPRLVAQELSAYLPEQERTPAKRAA